MKKFFTYGLATVNKKPIHFLLWLVAALYLLFSPTIFYHFFIQEGKPLGVWKMPLEENGEILYHIEGLGYWSKSIVAYEEGETYALGGWALLDAGPKTPQSDFDRFVIVYNDAKAYVFPVQIYLRPDLEDVFKDIYFSDLTSSGFNAVISRNALTTGSFGIGLLFKNKQDGSSYYIRTNQTLVRTPNHLLLKPVQ